MADLKIEDLELSFGALRILKGVDLFLKHGEIVALLGSSGSGKTTLLRAIAGLETPSTGAIHVGGKAVFDAKSKIDLAPEKRDLGFVFQSYALWPHKTVHENIAYALHLRSMPKTQVSEEVEKILADVGLAGLSGRYPGQLSGGQQQRVALARALVYGPPLILLDEPLSNLDAKLREEARLWIQRLIRRLGITAVFVTHDQAEAMALADRILLLDGGQVVQSGTPEDLYTNPRSFFVADFMGTNNVVPARGIEVGANSTCTVEALTGRFAATACEELAPGSSARCVIRVEAVKIADAAGPNRCEGTLITSMYMGGRWEHIFDVAGAAIRVIHPARLSKDRCWLDFPAADLWAFRGG